MPPPVVEFATALYLSRASDLLANSSPSTSAYLGSQQTEIQHRDGKPVLGGMRHRMCLACGTLMVPGVTCISSRGKPTPTNVKTRSTQGSGPQIHAKLVQNCKVCHKKTVAPDFPAETQTSYHDKKSKPSISETAAIPSVAINNPASGAKPSSAKTSSKQRAKARRDASGLQALLNKSKASTNSTPPPLELMDFMKA